MESHTVKINNIEGLLSQLSILQNHRITRKTLALTYSINLTLFPQFYMQSYACVCYSLVLHQHKPMHFPALSRCSFHTQDSSRCPFTVTPTNLSYTQHWWSDQFLKFWLWWLLLVISAFQKQKLDDFYTLRVSLVYIVLEHPGLHRLFQNNKKRSWIINIFETSFYHQI